MSLRCPAVRRPRPLGTSSMSLLYFVIFPAVLHHCTCSTLSLTLSSSLQYTIIVPALFCHCPCGTVSLSLQYAVIVPAVFRFIAKQNYGSNSPCTEAAPSMNTLSNPLLPYQPIKFPHQVED